ncbi:MAG: DUF885 domain-containing protein [Ignavibacteria bacterium]
MKHLIFIFLTSLIFCTAISKSNALPLKDIDSDFEAMQEKFISEYLDLNPQYATSLGFHQYDGKISDNSLASINEEIAWYESYKQRLSEIDPSSLNKENYIGYKILWNEVNQSLFNLIERKSYANNPMGYAGTIDVNIYISRDFAPIEDRVRSIIEIEKNAPKIFEQARTNLNDVLPKPYVELAINIARGNADFLGKDLIEALKDVNNEALMNEFNTVNQNAIKELNEYAGYLEKEKLPKADDSYHLGRDKYAKMLEGEMITLSPEKILEIGMEELKLEQRMFEETAKKIDPTKKAIDVFNELKKEHPTAEGLIPDTKKNLEAIRQFLIDKNIVTVPSDVRAIVKETPQYARATSFASMDTPGPFEKSTQAYYYVTPVEDSWSEKQKEEWLTAFNYYTTDVVSIHEAYPGHYIQFLHLNASPVTKLQKIFGSYAFAEGWAHYTEKMMIDEGFGKDKSDMTAAKYKLAQLDESLLRLCRLCVSVKMHCEGMNVDDATKFFTDNCYYEEQPAHSEAMRGTYDPGYLYYTLGKLMLLKLRDDYKIQEGENYSLKKFHDAVLENGSPAVPLLREIILDNKGKKKEIL